MPDSILRALAVLVPALLVAPGCIADQGTLGAPCEVGGDCNDGLLCDRHDDAGGSCQAAHMDANEPEALGCATDTRDDTYSLGLQRTGTWATVAFVDAQPAPPERGDNTWTMRVLDETGTPRSDLDIEVDPYMPDHTHGSTVRCDVESGEMPGTYVLAPLNLFMPGLWEITLHMHDAELGDDDVQFSFCVDP